MKLLIFLLISLTQTLVLGSAKSDATTDLLIDGVHCSGCTKMISKKVCGDKTLAESFETCGVTVVDKEKQIGKISVRLKEGKTLDTAAIDAAVKSAGEKYKLQTPQIKTEDKK
jgi:hypothetical protein